jgi:hypothetical protein
MAPLPDFFGNDIPVTPAVSKILVGKLDPQERANVKAEIAAADIADALMADSSTDTENNAETEKLAREAKLNASKMPQADIARACYYEASEVDKPKLRQRFRYEIKEGKDVVDVYDKEGNFVVTSHGIINTISLKGTDSFVMSDSYTADAKNTGSKKVQNMEAKWKHQFVDGAV